MHSLSVPMYSLYVEHVMRIARLKAMKIGDRKVNNLRYADDTTLFADNEEDLKVRVAKVQEESLKAGLSLSIKKTKIVSTGVH